jgi:hypothetical protein
MIRSRAADDFGTIRARMEELRRQRTPAPREHSSRPRGPRPDHVASSRRPQTVPDVFLVQFVRSFSDGTPEDRL